jgi:hypothetical protein
MSATSLPVCGISLRIGPLTGAEETLLWEAGPAANGLPHSDLRLTLMLAERTMADVNVEAGELTLTDLDTLLLLLRRSMFGDLVRAEARCASAGCDARMDVSFGITDYLESQKPETPRGVERLQDDPAWFRFIRGSTDRRFRPPTVGDVLSVDEERSPEEALFRRCVVPAKPITGRERRRIERALSEIAPILESEIDGVCPECGSTVKMAFSPRSFVLQELRGHAAFVMDEVHLLAMAYHWTESEILSLPRPRRRAYAGKIREMMQSSRPMEASYAG